MMPEDRIRALAEEFAAQSFRIRSDGDLQCPRCGILSGVQAALTCRPGQPTLDLFQCDTCGISMDVPAFAGRSA
jgi:hypothetical protein